MTRMQKVKGKIKAQIRRGDSRIAREKHIKTGKKQVFNELKNDAKSGRFVNRPYEKIRFVTPEKIRLTIQFVGTGVPDCPKK